MTDEQDAGFGIVEVIVSMVMFALLALALAPVLIGGVKASIKMTSIATATQFVNEGLEATRTSLTSCPASPPAPQVTTTTDSRDVELRRTITVAPDGDCTATKRVVINVKVAAVDNTPQFRSDQVISSARTVVFVG